jgi:hypothetical protein
MKPAARFSCALLVALVACLAVSSNAQALTSCPITRAEITAQDLAPITSACGRSPVHCHCSERLSLGHQPNSFALCHLAAFHRPTSAKQASIATILGSSDNPQPLALVLSLKPHIHTLLLLPLLHVLCSPHRPSVLLVLHSMHLWCC